ncbi:MAG: hypothetical protein J7D60_09890 [Prosthecochloris sp.]|nr:hypothetical protein [Prosthecochloris sp.]
MTGEPFTIHHSPRAAHPRQARPGDRKSITIAIRGQQKKVKSKKAKVKIRSLACKTLTIMAIIFVLDNPV